MPDMEKIIKGLEQTAARLQYGSLDNVTLGECEDAVFDALDLLRKKEPVKPIDENYWKHTMGRCGHCKAPLPAIEGLRSKFCWMCGRAVKWDEAD